MIINVEVKFPLHIRTLRFTTAPGSEYDGAVNYGAVESYSILPLFHAPVKDGQPWVQLDPRYSTYGAVYLLFITT